MIATYEKTIFKDESSGYCICSFQTKDETVPVAARSSYYHDGKIHFTATGCLLPETSTVQVELQGQWEKSRYGPQLSVLSYREILPTTEAGILGYLSSGLIKGIGPKTARQLVDAFGLDIGFGRDRQFDAFHQAQTANFFDNAFLFCKFLQRLIQIGG